MKFEEIKNFLRDTKEEISEEQSIDYLYYAFIELTVCKNELHKLIHFCLDDYERKDYISEIDIASSVQYIVNTKIKQYNSERLQRASHDFIIERDYVRKELKEYLEKSVLFKKFCSKLVPEPLLSEINHYTKHCAELNLTVKQYLHQLKYNKNFNNE
jgi:hypothetical protein